MQHHEVSAYVEKWKLEHESDRMTLEEFIECIYEHIFLMDTGQYLEDVFGVFDRCDNGHQLSLPLRVV